MRSVKTKIRPYLMVAPAMAGILLFTVYPIFRLIQLCLMDVNMLDKTKSKFVGFRNFQQVFARPDFRQALSNTFVYGRGGVLDHRYFSRVRRVAQLDQKSSEQSFAGSDFFPQYCVHRFRFSCLAMDDGTYLRAFQLSASLPQPSHAAVAFQLADCYAVGNSGIRLEKRRL